MDRDVTSKPGEKSVRKIGEAPNLGRVLRSPQSGTTKKRGGLTSAGRKRRRKRIIMKWSIVFAVISVGIVMFFLVSHFRSLALASKKIVKLAPDTPDLEKIFSDDSELDTETPSEKVSLEFVTSALSNRNPEDVTEFFKLPLDKKPEDVIRILEELEAQEGTVSKTDWLGTAFANGSLMNQVVVHMEKDGRSVNRLAQLVPQPDREWRIDFDSYIRAVSADWESILAGKSSLSTVRVFVALDHYYKGIFSENTIWQAYTLASPDTEEILYAYAKRESPQFRAMQKLLESDEHLHRATLEITSFPDAGKRQFQISRVFAENWVIGEKSFDESF
jgi:hypothetical protein|tara:strand:+ start:970 stop:1965 length:996 start_codon:yes stop_codon:yes gene_type:complete